MYNTLKRVVRADIKRYDIWIANIPGGDQTHVQYGIRPVLVVSNDMANKNSPVITAIPLISQLHKRHLPTHVLLRDRCLERNSLALCEQILSVDKSCLERRIGFLYKELDRLAVCHALAIQLGMAA